MKTPCAKVIERLFNAGDVSAEIPQADFTAAIRNFNGSAGDANLLIVKAIEDDAGINFPILEKEALELPVFANMLIDEIFSR